VGLTQQRRKIESRSTPKPISGKYPTKGFIVTPQLYPANIQVSIATEDEKTNLYHS
jgi:hypothetical protein